MTAVIWSQCHSMLVTGGPWPEIMVSQLSLLLLGGFNIFIFISLIYTNKVTCHGVPPCSSHTYVHHTHMFVTYVRHKICQTIKIESFQKL